MIGSSAGKIREAVGDRPDSALFHDAMSRVGGAVTIVTTAGPAGRAGFTATSFAPVSDAPPTVLVCLNQASRVAPILLANGHFCVNVLPIGADSIALADNFAGRTGRHGAERFVGGPWQDDAAGLPFLPAALAAFTCRLIDVRDVATHHVLFGEVLSIHAGDPAGALIYRGRGYRDLP